MTIFSLMPRGILSAHTWAQRVKSVLPGIWMGSWFFTPKNINEYWLLLINYLALLMLPFFYMSPISSPLKKGKENSNNKNTFQWLFIL